MDERVSGKLAILFPCVGGLFIWMGVDMLVRGSQFTETLSFGVVILIIGLVLLRYNIKRHWT
ncbi:MAG: hypothetical protein OEV85_11435 [Candidatus Thorarchaeota archaeon]|nr:hypothetical protein [Candidatus Thorarchaeota archaeon]